MQNIGRLLLKAIKFSAIKNNSYVSRNLKLCVNPDVGLL